MELTPEQLQTILQRFPSFELSYETISHKKVSPTYEIALSIPSGRKYYLWMTFFENRDVCYLMERNKDKRIVRASMVKTHFSNKCSRGTVLYGTLMTLENCKPVFVVEDLYVYQGIPLKHLCFADKLGFIRKLFCEDRTLSMQLDSLHLDDCLPVHLPFMWLNQPTENSLGDSLGDSSGHLIPPDISEQIHYPIHHVQYRELHRIRPYLNVPIGLKEEPFSHATAQGGSNNHTDITDASKKTCMYVNDFTKPQYKHPAVFRVSADIQFDIYHLHAAGPNGTTVYYDVAYIPNYKKSVFMNGLFRKIRENINLDYIEESDDEDDFEDMREDKYVDLKKTLHMECIFHTKFKRWIPVRIVNPREKLVYIYKLAK
jgi:hypothetical protein